MVNVREQRSISDRPLRARTVATCPASSNGKAFGALYDDPALDKLYEEGNTKLNVADQAPYIKQIMALEQNDLSTITLWQYVDVYAMKKSVTYTPGVHGLEVVYLPEVKRAM